MTRPAAETSFLRVAFQGLCPRCGRVSIFDGLLTIRRQCPACGLDFQGEDAGDGAAVFVILLLGAIVVLLGVLVDNAFQPPLWVHALLWVPFTFAGAIVMLRWVKAGLIAQQFRVHLLDPTNTDKAGTDHEG